jgi:hypothetical protein
MHFVGGKMCDQMKMHGMNNIKFIFQLRSQQVLDM